MKANRIIALFIVLMFESISFGQDSYSFLCPKLNVLFEQFIQINPSKKYYIISEKNDDSNIVIFGTSADIPEHFIDYYVTDEKRFVAYYSVDSIYDKTVIDTAKMIRYNNQLEELSNSSYFSNCISNTKRYIGQGNSYKEIGNDFCLNKSNKAVASNGINSKKFNIILNSFINTYKNARVYEIRFMKLKKKLYAAIYWNHFYDLNSIDAYFYRNGNFIAIYGLKNVDPNSNILNRKEIFFYNNSIRGIRCGTKSNWYVPIPTVYLIENKKIKHIRDKKAFDLIEQSINKYD